MTDWEWLGDALAIDVANTIKRHHERYVDLLASPADLLEWTAHEARHVPTPLPPRLTERDLRSFLDLRDHVLTLLQAKADGEALPEVSLDAVNDVATARPVVRLLSPPDGIGATRLLHPGDPVADLLATVAASTIELLAGPERDRIALCDAPSCGQLYLRARPNQQWCGPGCGNRARAARYHRSHTGVAMHAGAGPGNRR